MKSMQRVLIGLLLTFGSFQASAGLLTFEWKFLDVVGTATGLTDNATTAASQVTITSSYGLFNQPQDTIGTGPVPFNSWGVYSGVLLDVDFLSIDFHYLDYEDEQEGYVRFALKLYGPLFGMHAEGLLLDNLIGAKIRGPISATRIPEPGTLGLLAAGILGVGLMGRKRAA